MIPGAHVENYCNFYDYSVKYPQPDSWKWFPFLTIGAATADTLHTVI